MTAEFLSEYKYALIFVGLLAAGEAVLIPAIYFAFAGRLELPLVVTLAFAATIVSDALWYFLGRWFGRGGQFLQRFVWTERVKSFSAYFSRNSFVALFFSKFIYGTRIAAQVLSGISKMALRNYFAVNAAATAAWIFCLVILGAGFSAGIDELSSTVRVLGQFTGFVAVLLVLLFSVRNYAKKIWFL